MDYPLDLQPLSAFESIWATRPQRVVARLSPSLFNPSPWVSLPHIALGSLSIQWDLPDMNEPGITLCMEL